MCTNILLVSIFIVKLVSSAPLTEDDFVISLPNGQVQGASYVTRNGVTYYGFRGIPYAVPPVGDLRFELARPAETWTGILDATDDQKACISNGYLDSPQSESEDCLYVNVYVPTLEPQEKLPVMFWIYGGGFVQGSSNKSLYGPDYIVERDVIFVSFNYRLGAFGFISTEDEVLPGNLGLKDQNIALQWTRSNIEYFGGDPEKITVFGQSAGGASTGLHLVSKLSSGLFRAAIVESGSALTYWSIGRDSRTTAFLFADGISGGNYGNDSTKLKEFLKSTSVEEIVKATSVLPDQKQFWPVVEVDHENAFLSEAPYQLLASGDFNQVPIMTGICAEESLMFLKDLEYTRLASLAADTLNVGVMPTDLQPNSTDQEAALKAIKGIYMNEGDKYTDHLVAFADHYTDSAFTNGVLKQAELTTKYAPVFLYEFAYYGRIFTEAFIPGAEKASHSAELPFLFNMTYVSDTTDPQDLQIQLIVSTLWTNFAKFLNPTPEDSDLFAGILWPELNVTKPQYLNINDTLEVRENLKGAAYTKWNEIYDTFGAKPFVTF